MARCGINPENTLGVSIPVLRKIAGETGHSHTLASELWATGLHEAGLLASMIDDPRQVSRMQAEQWASDFDSWDLCDQCCNNLLRRTSFAFELARQWSRREEEWVRRAGFVLMAALAVHAKEVGDTRIADFLPLIRAAAHDDRNYVRKAVNWALRQIGKRSRRLNRLARQTAKEIAHLDSRSARWIGTDALRELESAPVEERLRRKESRSFPRRPGVRRATSPTGKPGERRGSSRP